jgi:hypothetical protein
MGNVVRPTESEARNASAEGRTGVFHGCHPGVTVRLWSVQAAKEGPAPTERGTA